ncbi:MAG: GTP-binding protein [Oceanospirillaceae bacterium]|nr:GTP-binding protein [Oceanospirillaceae bacterium]
MSIERHDLVHEFPEFRERIRELKASDAHFSKLFDEYDELTREVRLMEEEVHPTSTGTEESFKLRRVHLKDQLYAMLRA